VRLEGAEEVYGFLCKFGFQVGQGTQLNLGAADKVDDGHPARFLIPARTRGRLGQEVGIGAARAVELEQVPGAASID